MKHKFLLGVASALILLPGAAAAQSTAPIGSGRFVATLKGGPEFVVDGDVHGGASAPIANLGPLNPALAGVAATLEIDSRSYDDVYLLRAQCPHQSA